MNNELNINDYISDAQKEEIAADVFKKHCLETYKKDHERIFGNVAHGIVKQLVIDSFDEDLNELIKNKAISRINTLSNYDIFKPRTIWEKDNCGGFNALKEAVTNNKDLIDIKVKGVIGELNTVDVRDQINEAINDVLTRVLPDKKKL